MKQAMRNDSQKEGAPVFDGTSSNLLIPDTNYKKWHEGFLQLIDHMPHSSFSTRVNTVSELLFDVCEDWEDRESAGLYKLHALLYVMHDADQFKRMFGFIGPNQHEMNSMFRDQTH